MWFAFLVLGQHGNTGGRRRGRGVAASLAGRGVTASGSATPRPSSSAASTRTGRGRRGAPVALGRLRSPAGPIGLQSAPGPGGREHPPLVPADRSSAHDAGTPIEVTRSGGIAPRPRSWTSTGSPKMRWSRRTPPGSARSDSGRLRRGHPQRDRQSRPLGHHRPGPATTLTLVRRRPPRPGGIHPVHRHLPGIRHRLLRRSDDGLPAGLTMSDRIAAVGTVSAWRFRRAAPVGRFPSSPSTARPTPSSTSTAGWTPPNSPTCWARGSRPSRHRPRPTGRP